MKIEEFMDSVGYINVNKGKSTEILRMMETMEMSSWQMSIDKKFAKSFHTHNTH